MAHIRYPVNLLAVNVITKAPAAEPQTVLPFPQRRRLKLFDHVLPAAVVRIDFYNAGGFRKVFVTVRMVFFLRDGLYSLRKTQPVPRAGRYSERLSRETALAQRSPLSAEDTRDQTYVPAEGVNIKVLDRSESPLGTQDIGPTC